MKLLFVCDYGQNRSKTFADNVNLNYKDKFKAKYCGIHPKADIPLNNKLINWADKIVILTNNQHSLVDLTNNPKFIYYPTKDDEYADEYFLEFLKTPLWEILIQYSKLIPNSR